MTVVPAFMAALREEHGLAHADLQAAVESGDEVRKALALSRLADLQDIVTRSLDVMSLEAEEARRRLAGAAELWGSRPGTS